MRKPLIAGNWKMNNTVEESLKIAEKIVESMEDFNKDREVLICAPYTSLYSLSKLLVNSKVKLGAQNMFYEDKGAFTGEISPLMLKELNIEYIIIGHSERRQFFHEDDLIINKKILSALKHKFKPIVCVGETLLQRETGMQKDIIKNQILKDFNNINKNDIEKIVIAYEPIWAIGTGKTATAFQANEMVSYIRKLINELYGTEASESVRIQYGGSVKPNNAFEIMSQSDIDGALVGGASLKAQDFVQIINY